ncbi:MAG TPA: hypothetical protein VFT56_14270 [Sphingomonas sp.]|nr:hypothetical protein [Sphingomonas sp.]
MKTIILTLIALLYASCALALGGPGDASPVAASNSGVLVKMTSGMSSTASKPGDVLTGEIIDPVSLRGARLQGTVDRADHSILKFSFQTLSVDGKSYPVQSQLTSIVNSKGDEGKDDLDQRIRIDGGIIAYGTATALDEGAEVHMSIWKK